MSDPIGSRAAPRRQSWYLDRLAAEQKRNEHLALLQDWSTGSPAVILKTDLFEESQGADELLSSFPADATIIGMDVVPATVARARARGLRRAAFLVTDVRRLALADASVDLVFSNSTLDHFDLATDIEASLAELARVLRPGGRLIVTLDNPLNPLYGILRWMSRRGWAPFALGHTASRVELMRLMERTGVEVIESRTLIHNPRLISTAVFITLRRLLGRAADVPIRGLLRLFALAGRWPTREYSACFIAVCGRKPGHE